MLRQGEIEVLEALTKLLKSGKDPRRILDVLQIAVGQIVLETRDPTAFNMPHHCYEYHNTLAWFYDKFDHPRRLRLLYVAALFANRVAYQSAGPGRGTSGPAAGAVGRRSALSAAHLLDRVDAAILRAERGRGDRLDAGLLR